LLKVLYILNYCLDLFIHNNQRHQNIKKMATKLQPENIIEIPTISNLDLFYSNQDRANEKNLDSCPCCGKAIKSSNYFINSIWGGSAYPATDKTEYDDAWQMAVGSECKNKFPEGYVFKK